MLELLKNTYSDVEGLKGKKLLRLLAIIFVIFIVLGGIVGYITSLKLNESETPAPNAQVQTSAPVSYQGIVTYLGEDMYSEDKITFSLTDAEGNDIILLKANDDKLNIVQGLFVTVIGKRGTTIDKKHDVLLVTEVTLNNK